MKMRWNHFFNIVSINSKCFISNFPFISLYSICKSQTFVLSVQKKFNLNHVYLLQVSIEIMKLYESHQNKCNSTHQVFLITLRFQYWHKISLYSLERKEIFFVMRLKMMYATVKHTNFRDIRYNVINIELEACVLSRNNEP